MVHLMEACLLTALQAYLLGSLLFGVLVSKLFYHDDVRLHGSGNAGMTNVLRTYGKLPAVGKSVVAVKLGQFIFDSLLSGTGADFQPLLQPICGAYLAAIFCMLGHSKPVFFGLRGGKGVLVGAGAALATEPIACLVLLVIFLVEVAITHIVSLGSIIIAALYPVLTLCYWLWKGTDAASLVFITDMLRVNGRLCHLAAPFQHPAPEERHRISLWREKERKPVILLHFLFFSIASALPKRTKLMFSNPRPYPGLGFCAIIVL